jgi:NADH:ubiquinone oxidoreductase subunit 4 (subunit M)
MLRMFIRTMHNRTGPAVHSRDIELADAIVLVPVIGVILLFAFYPQLALRRSEPAVKASVAGVQASSPTAVSVIK